MKEGRVLVVDDEPMVRETLGQVLADEGYVVDLAVDGESALGRVRDALPDAILLDLMMPGMNGRQFLQALRGDPEYANVPVLIMTAVHGLEVNLTTLGASEVVEKPFNVDELLNKIALAVYRSRNVHQRISQPMSNANLRSGDPVGLPGGAGKSPVASGGDPDGLPGGKSPVASMSNANRRAGDPDGLPGDEDRGVVLIVEHDRRRLQQLDVLLSARGYTVVSMTRAIVQLSRLARALRPRAILLDVRSPGVQDVILALRAVKDLDSIPVLVFARGGGASGETVAHAADADLVSFVDRQY